MSLNLDALLPTDDEVNEWIDFACEKNGCPALSERITWEWNTRFTSKGGDARSKSELGVFTHGHIRLSVMILGNMSKEEQRNIVIHEACHIIANVRHNYLCGHGLDWKITMMKCGVRPDRCHTVDLGINRVDAACPCGTIKKVSKMMAGKIQRGQRRFCNSCKGIVTVC